MKRTLLQIDACKNTGSTGKISEDIGRVAISHGWNSWKGYSRMRRDSQPSQSHLIEIGSKLGFYSSFIETRLLDNHCMGWANVAGTKWLIRQIEEINPSIIHLHDIKGYFLNIKKLFEYLATKDIPVLWSMHSCWQFTGHCSHFELIGCERWKTGCHNCPSKGEYPSSWLLDRSRKNWKEKRDLFLGVKNLTMIPVSQWLSDLVGQSFLKDIPRVVIHNGIDLNDFNIKNNVEKTKKKYGLEDKFTIIGVAGVWSEGKGLSDFIKLRELLPRNCQIVMVGLTDDQMQSLPEGIIGIKRTESREEMAVLYSLSDLFFNPTYQDTFPTVNLEALACGTPVVTYRTGGSVEAVDENTGFVIDQGNYKMLPSIIDIVETKGKNYYQKVCRERAEKHYDKDKCFEQYIGLYERILSGK